MQLLLEMIPEHKNINRIKDEVVLLEGMISNMLLSDRLSTPYQDLDISPIKLSRMVNKVLSMFYNHTDIVEVKGEIPVLTLEVDEMKFSLAIRNLIDNAQKYASSSEKIQLYMNVKNDNLYINIKDFGPGIHKEDIEKLTTPFYRILKKVK